MENYSNYSEMATILSVFIGIFFATLISYFYWRLFFKINLFIKKNKIKKLSKKYELTNYNLRLNAKGMPVMFVHKANSGDIILI